MLNDGEFLSVIIFAYGDAFYKIHTQSGFSCHQLTQLHGFHAGKTGGKKLILDSWAKLKGWRVFGAKGLYSFGGVFDTGTGYFTVAKNGAYYCTARIRFERDPEAAGLAGDIPDVRVSLRVDEEEDDKNGLYAAEGDGMSSNRHSLNVAGTVLLQAGRRVSVWVYSNIDIQVHPDSGFGCHIMGEYKGFHANLLQNKKYSQGWSTIQRWRTWTNNELYAWKGRPTPTGNYPVSESGFYVCAAQVRKCSAVGNVFVTTI